MGSFLRLVTTAFVLSCASSLANDAVSDGTCLNTRQGQCSDTDTVSMLQTSLKRQGRRGDFSEKLAEDLNTTKAKPSSSWSTITPYRAIAANRSEISNLPINLSIGQLLAYEPDKPVNDHLFVFLPGSWVSCSNYSQLLEAIGTSMKTVCLPYDNVKSMADICKDDGQCWYNKRLAAHNGSFEGIAGNNILSRLRSALDFLETKHGQAWNGYRTNSSVGLNFESIRIAGHSQGAGAAAFMGYQQKVARVLQFSGPCDPSEWPQKLHSATPADRFFAMASYYDHFCDWESKQVPAWWGEGIVSEGAEPLYVAQESLESFDPAYSQSVISMIESPVCEFEYCLRDYHDSTALNKWVAPARAPYTMGLWQRLAGIL